MFEVLVERVASATGMHPVQVALLAVLTAYARSARQESRAVHRLLTGEEAVDGDDGVIGRVRSLEERVADVEERLTDRKDVRPPVRGDGDGR
jgi:hypothetical protein